MLQAMDRDDFLETAFGLRLIDQRMKRDFRERMDEPEQFAGFIESQYAEVAKDGIKASLLAVESRGDRGRAVVRFDMSHFQSNYYEYDLRLTESGELQILDWTDFLWGHKITDSIGLAMVQAQPSASAARKLADTSNLSQAQVFQLMEILKSTRDRNFERYFQIVEQLDDNMKRQRIVLKTGLDARRVSAGSSAGCWRLSTSTIRTTCCSLCRCSITTFQTGSTKRPLRRWSGCGTTWGSTMR